MVAVELSLVVFAACNVLRIAAYVPQMVKVTRHPQGAAGFSYATWTMFGAANASTAVYAASALGDAALSAVHAVSALCCAVLVTLAAWRQRCPRGGAAQAAGRPARSRSARNMLAHGSTRIEGSLLRSRATLLNAPRRSTVTKRDASAAWPRRSEETAATR